MAGPHKDSKACVCACVFTCACVYLSGLSEAHTESIMPTSNVPYKEKYKIESLVQKHRDESGATKKLWMLDVLLSRG